MSHSTTPRQLPQPQRLRSVVTAIMTSRFLSRPVLVNGTRSNWDNSFINLLDSDDWWFEPNAEFQENEDSSSLVPFKMDSKDHSKNFSSENHTQEHHARRFENNQLTVDAMEGMDEKSIFNMGGDKSEIDPRALPIIPPGWYYRYTYFLWALVWFVSHM